MTVTAAEAALAERLALEGKLLCVPCGYKAVKETPVEHKAKTGHADWFLEVASFDVPAEALG